MLLAARTTFITAATMGPFPLFACTLCDSAQAVSVRARLVQPDLWLTLCAIMAPLALLAGIIALIAHDPAGASRLK